MFIVNTTTVIIITILRLSIVINQGAFYLFVEYNCEFSVIFDVMHYSIL